MPVYSFFFVGVTFSKYSLREATASLPESSFIASKSRSSIFGDVSTGTSVVASVVDTLLSPDVSVSSSTFLYVFGSFVSEASGIFSDVFPPSRGSTTLSIPAEAKLIWPLSDPLVTDALTSTTKLSITPSFSTARSTDVYWLYILYGLYTSESTAHITMIVAIYTTATIPVPIRLVHHLRLSNAIIVHIRIIAIITGITIRIISDICAFILDMTVSALSAA